MANVTLTNADNVDCLFAGQSLSLFMDTSRRSNVIAVCADSTVEDLPIVLSLTLQRVEVDGDDDGGGAGRGRHASLLPSSSRALQVQRQPAEGSDGEDGLGADAVSFGVDGRRLLKVTIDLASFPDKTSQLSLLHPAAVEHDLIHSVWLVHSAYRLRLHLRSAANAAWPLQPSPQWSDTPAASSSYMAATPRSHHQHLTRDVSESVYYVGDDSMARPPSTVRSMTSRTTRLFNPSEPRSQLQGPLFVDQTLFPIIRLLFVPALYTKSFSTPPNLVWNMSMQITVDKAVVRKTRRLLRDRQPRHEAPKPSGTCVNVTVEEAVRISSSEWGDEAQAGAELEAIALSFDADHRDWSSVGGRRDTADAVDVARAQRLAVGDFTFDLFVSAKKQATVTVDEIMRAVHTYCGDRDEVSMLDVDLEDVIDFIYDRYPYMKTTPYLDGMDFHNTVWQAVRLYMVHDVLEGAGFDSDVDDTELFMDGVLATA